MQAPDISIGLVTFPMILIKLQIGSLKKVLEGIRCCSTFNYVVKVSSESTQLLLVTNASQTRTVRRARAARVRVMRAARAHTGLMRAGRVRAHRVQ